MNQYFLNTEICFGDIDFLKKTLSGIEWELKPWFYMPKSFSTPTRLYNDRFLSSLKKDLGGNLHFYQIPALSVYNWHVDTKQMCAMNMVIEEYNSHTIFRNSKGIMTPIIPVGYQTNTWHLFNTQIEHMIINLDSRPRTIISYRFDTVKFSELSKWVKSFKEQEHND